MIDKPCKYGVYSLALKQILLDNMTSKSKSKEINKDSKTDNASEHDGSNGLSSRLDRVKITAEAEEDVNGNRNGSERSDDNGNKPAKTTLKEKTIIVKDKVSSKSSEVRDLTFSHHHPHLTRFQFC